MRNMLKSSIRKIGIFILSALFALQLPTLYGKHVASLMAKGFPYDYAKRLSVLQQLYPKWQFEVLPISQMEPKYTWDYIIHMETEASSSRSLISGQSQFSAYFHASDTKEYDAGFRRASAAAVAYFLDPRNFLNESDIFQFQNLCMSSHVSIKDVQYTLRNTFMEQAVLENGQTHAECIYYVGRILNIDPLFLASRLRQEQGMAGTPLVSGACGSRLAYYFQHQIQNEKGFSVLAPASGHTVEDLKKYDGLYNYFNINAAGSGRFTIYLNGMREAEAGSPHMVPKWGSPRWDTRWKAICGGAWKIAHFYVSNYQNTLYLQKWNVDPRCRSSNGSSRNFWGQYMQNIGAAFSEGNSIYRGLKSRGLLNLPFCFLIPVYSNMPQFPSPDPSNGRCQEYRNGRLPPI